MPTFLTRAAYQFIRLNFDSPDKIVENATLSELANGMNSDTFGNLTISSFSKPALFCQVAAIMLRVKTVIYSEYEKYPYVYRKIE